MTRMRFVVVLDPFHGSPDDAQHGAEKAATQG